MQKSAPPFPNDPSEGLAGFSLFDDMVNMEKPEDLNEVVREFLDAESSHSEYWQACHTERLER
jgi:hypothetical protein